MKHGRVWLHFKWEWSSKYVSICELSPRWIYTDVHHNRLQWICRKNKRTISNIWYEQWDEVQTICFKSHFGSCRIVSRRDRDDLYLMLECCVFFVHAVTVNFWWGLDLPQDRTDMTYALWITCLSSVTGSWYLS